MKKFYLFIFILILTIQSSNIAQQSQNIFQPIEEDQLINETQKDFLNNIKSDKNFKKLKLVKLVNFNLFKSDNFSFKLFDNTLYNFDITLNKLDSISYKISGVNNSNSISLIFRNGKITGTINISNKQFSIIPLGSEIHAIIEVDYSKLKPEAPPVIIKSQNQVYKNNSVQTATSYIDLLVVYTPAG